MAYVDGYVIPVKREKLDVYREMARLGRDVWREHGAIDYMECLADDVPYGELTSFPRAVMAAEDEVVVFSFIVYPDRATRDEVNRKVMEDPRMTMGEDPMPFDGKRLIFGGFQAFMTFGDATS